MTRQELVTLSDSILMAALGSAYSDDPFTTGTPTGGFLDQAADAVCAATGCFYDVQNTDLVAGQGVYCAPTIYRVKDVYLVDVAGNMCDLIVRTPAQMTRQYGANWRTWTSQDPPRFMVPEGDTRVRLSPVPAVSRSGALYFEGYALTTSKTSPGVGSLTVPDGDGGTGFTGIPNLAIDAPPGVGGVRATAVATIAGGALTGGTVVLKGNGYTLGPPNVVISGGGGTGASIVANLVTAHLWPNPGDPCPLPEDAQTAVLYKLLALRTMQQLGNKDPAVRQIAAGQLAEFERQYRSERGMVEANTAKRYPSQRLGPMGMGRYGGGW